MIPEVSNDLGTWQRDDAGLVVVSDTIEPTPGGLERVLHLRSAQPSSAAARQFFRLAIEAR